MKKAASAMLPLFLLGCGVDSSEQSLKSISLPGQFPASNSLLWLKGEDFQFGACSSDRLPSIDTCPSQFTYNEKVFQRDLITPLVGSLDKLKQDLTAELKKLKDQHPAVAPALATLNTVKSALETEKGKLTVVVAAIQDLNQKLASDQKLQADYEQQIDDVKKRLLDDPSNPRLTNLPTVLQSEKEALVSRITSNKTSLETKTKEKADLTIRISDLEKQRIDAETNYIIKFNSITVESETSVALNKQIQGQEGDLGAFRSIRELAVDGISYRQTMLSPAEKKALSAVLVQTTGFDIRTGGNLFYRDGTTWLPVDSATMGASLAEVICRTLGKTYRSYSSVYTGSQSMVRLNHSCQGKEATAKSCSSVGSIAVNNNYQTTIACDSV